MRLGSEEVGCLKVAIIQHFREDIPVVPIEEEDTNLTTEVLDVIDDFPGSGLP